MSIAGRYIQISIISFYSHDAVITRIEATRHTKRRNMRQREVICTNTKFVMLFRRIPPTTARSVPQQQPMIFYRICSAVGFNDAYQNLPAALFEELVSLQITSRVLPLMEDGISW
jgi:hypothetical protein